jgi:L-asparagine oxygenase
MSLEVADQLGIIDEVEGLPTVQTLSPRKVSGSPPNTYSANFGYAEFPLHTDLAQWAPPRYLLLRCIRGTQHVSTRILDGRQLIGIFGANRLFATLVQPRRPMRNGKQLLRLLCQPDDFSRDLLRWDSIYLRPASPISSKVFGEILDFLCNVKPMEVNLLQPGDTLLIDNWRCLHGRSAASEEEQTRHIERIYLKEVR